MALTANKVADLCRGYSTVHTLDKPVLTVPMGLSHARTLL
jgi:hypothetical protein